MLPTNWRMLNLGSGLGLAWAFSCPSVSQVTCAGLLLHCQFRRTHMICSASGRPIGEVERIGCDHLSGLVVFGFRLIHAQDDAALCGNAPGIMDGMAACSSRCAPAASPGDALSFRAACRMAHSACQGWRAAPVGDTTRITSSISCSSFLLLLLLYDNDVDRRKDQLQRGVRSGPADCAVVLATTAGSGWTTMAMQHPE